MSPIKYLLLILPSILIICSNPSPSIGTYEQHKLDIDPKAQDIFLNISELIQKCGPGQGLLICYKSWLLNNQEGAKVSRRFQLMGLEKFGPCKNSSDGPHQSGLLFTYQDGELVIETSFGFNLSIIPAFPFGIQLREAHSLLSTLRGCEADVSTCEALNKLGEMFNQTLQKGKVPYMDDFGGIWYLGLVMIAPKTSKINKNTSFWQCSSGILTSEATTTVNTDTSHASIQPTNDWPRSTELTEEQKQQKLKECQRNIDEYNLILGHDMRELDEEDCLMNMEEKMQMWNLGAPDDDNKPIEEGKKCEDANCQLIEPIPEDTPLTREGINMGHHETEEKIMVSKRNDQHRMEETMTVYCNDEYFDLRMHAKSEICRRKIEEIEDQGRCPSCTFAATVSAITGRHCISTLVYQPRRGRFIDICNKRFLQVLHEQYSAVWLTGRKDIEEMCKLIEQNKLSIRDPMECMTYSCQNSTTRELIWKFHTINYMLKDSCKPYRCCPDQPKPVKCCLNSENSDFCFRSGTCDSIPVSNDKYSELGPKSVIQLSGTKFVRTIMDDIVYNGPVTAGMTIFSDFHNKMEKKIYTVSKNAKNISGHAVRLIGFGEKKCGKAKGGPTLFITKYWIAANSWGKEWNGDGTFRIRRGTNEAGIENRVISARPVYWDMAESAVRWMDGYLPADEDLTT